MRKITAGLFVSVDGVVEDPQDWHFPYFNDEMGVAVDRQLGSADTVLLGRVTYDSFAGAWPDREEAGGEDAGMAKALGDARKIVVSTQDLQFTWRNSEQLKGDLLEAVTELKNEPGGSDIAMSGSVSVVRQLLAAGLLDELHLLVHPIAVRKGARLFDDGEPIPLKLLSSETFETGVLHLTYTRDTEAPSGGYEEAKAHLQR
jgi:dihydrofolate reductase